MVCIRRRRLFKVAFAICTHCRLPLVNLSDHAFRILPFPPRSTFRFTPNPGAHSESGFLRFTCVHIVLGYHVFGIIPEFVNVATHINWSRDYLHTLLVMRASPAGVIWEKQSKTRRRVGVSGLDYSALFCQCDSGSLASSP